MRNRPQLFTTSKFSFVTFSLALTLWQAVQRKVKCEWFPAKLWRKMSENTWACAGSRIYQDLAYHWVTYFTQSLTHYSRFNMWVDPTGEIYFQSKSKEPLESRIWRLIWKGGKGLHIWSNSFSSSNPKSSKASYGNTERQFLCVNYLGSVLFSDENLIWSKMKLLKRKTWKCHWCWNPSWHCFFRKKIIHSRNQHQLSKK